MVFFEVSNAMVQEYGSDWTPKCTKYMLPPLKTMCQAIKVLKQPIIRVYNWTNVQHLDFYTFPPIHQPLESRHFLSGSEERTTAAGESSHRVQTHVSLKRSVILNVPETRNTSAQALSAAERGNKQQEFNQKEINTPQTQIMDNVPLNLNKQLILSAVSDRFEAQREETLS